MCSYNMRAHNMRMQYVRIQCAHVCVRVVVVVVVMVVRIQYVRIQYVRIHTVCARNMCAYNVRMCVRVRVIASVVAIPLLAIQYKCFSLDASRLDDRHRSQAAARARRIWLKAHKPPLARSQNPLMPLTHVPIAQRTPPGTHLNFPPTLAH